ncbi:MAG: hypothetical protein KF729_32535 [Sandaracinaceae bacterium]|nr:hypothetical protein [Sandaracinaceae bacterium]
MSGEPARRFAPARLLGARPAAEEQVLLEVEPPDGFLEAHARPGQFCRIRAGGAEGFFAMLSGPGAPPRFLVRVGNPDGGEAADALAALPPGSPIEMTLPEGRGFDLDRARGKDVCFVATGTGVAPVCAAIEHVLADRAAYGALRLDLGLKSAGHLALGPALERWRASGVTIEIAYSTLDAGGALAGASVQDNLRSSGVDLARAAVVAVGQGAMLGALREVIRAAGGDPAGLITNV